MVVDSIRRLPANTTAAVKNTEYNRVPFNVLTGRMCWINRVKRILNARTFDTELIRVEQRNSMLRKTYPYYIRLTSQNLYILV